MKTLIPLNTVSKDYEGILSAFVKQISEAEKDNLVSIFLTGSFARGEATESSDLDIWCIFKELNTEILSKAGNISRNLPISYNQLEVNSQCLTINEFQSGHFAKFLAYPIIYFEAILLFGTDVADKAVQDEEADSICKEILAEILLSIRHYIAVNEPAEKLTFQKIKTRVLNPLMFALRLERYLHTKQYPLTHMDLLNAYTIPPISILYFNNRGKWDTDINNDCGKTLYSLHEEVSNMLRPE